LQFFCLALIYYWIIIIYYYNPRIHINPSCPEVWMNLPIKVNLTSLIDLDVSGTAGRILWIWGPVWKFNHDILVIGSQDSNIKRMASLCLTTVDTAHRFRCDVGMSPFHTTILMAEIVVHRSRHNWFGHTAWCNLG